jgi:hypothetical protein
VAGHVPVYSCWSGHDAGTRIGVCMREEMKLSALQKEGVERQLLSRQTHKDRQSIKRIASSNSNSRFCLKMHSRVQSSKQERACGLCQCHPCPDLVGLVTVRHVHTPKLSVWITASLVPLDATPLSLAIILTNLHTEAGRM